MQPKFFSIVVVSLNAGDRLKKTLDSITNQSFIDYQVVIKDGGSTDGSIGALKEQEFFQTHNQFQLIEQKDGSIYEGMNQALQYITGKYVLFLNCGDTFYSEKVLQQVFDFITDNERNTDSKNNGQPYIYYGNQYNLLQSCVVPSAPVMNDFACYRNVPCHQVCFYDRYLFDKRGYLPQYNVRGDYEHFLYSIYVEHAVAVKMPHIICFYEGGGYSETKENLKRSKEQHKEITDRYLGKKAFKYRLIMIFTLSGLRTKLAESKRFSGIYNALKSFLYHS